MIYRFVWMLCQLVFGLLFRRRVVGVEHIPRTGAFILASNHISNLDPPLVGTCYWRPSTFMAKEELFRHPAFAWLFRHLNAFPIKRGTADRAALKLAFESLENGSALVIFPEGTRSENGELQAPEMGVGMMAYRSGVPVVPAWIHGTDQIMPKGGGFRFGRVFVAYGSPLHFEVPEGKKPGREEYEAAAHQVMEAIAGLRDRYAGKP